MQDDLTLSTEESQLPPALPSSGAKPKRKPRPSRLAISKFLLESSRFHSEEEIVDAVIYALPRDPLAAKALVHEILCRASDVYFRRASDGKYTLTKKLRLGQIKMDA